MITQDEALALAREVGAQRGLNFKGADVSLDSYWCAALDGCDCGKVGEDEVCTKPTKGVYLSDDALTALCNKVRRETRLEAADTLGQIDNGWIADNSDIWRCMAALRKMAEGE